MSSPKYASPLHIELNPSAMLRDVLLLLHAGAVVCLLFVDLSSAARMGLVLAVVGNYWLTAATYGVVPTPLLRLVGGSSNLTTKLATKWQRYFPIKIVEIVWDVDDQWKLLAADGEEHKANLLPSSYVHPRLIVLNVILPDAPWYQRRRAFVLLADNVDSQTFRRLRVRLRWYANLNPENSGVPK